MWYSLCVNVVRGGTTEQFFLPGHFRNCYLHHRNWRAAQLWEIISGCPELPSSRRGTLSMYVKYRKLPMVAPALLLAASFSLAFASTSTTKPQPANPAAKAQKDSHHAIHHTSKRTRKVRARGQKAIDGERV